jgi:hypothetical protein
MRGLPETATSQVQMTEPSIYPVEEKSFYRQPNVGVHEFRRDASVKFNKVGGHILVRRKHKLIDFGSARQL